MIRSERSERFALNVGTISEKNPPRRHGLVKMNDDNDDATLYASFVILYSKQIRSLAEVWTAWNI